MPNIKSFGKLYLSFAAFLGLIFLLQRTPYAGSSSMDNSIISNAIHSIQSLLENGDIQRLLLTIVILVTFYVAMETLVFLRECAGYLYFKFKKNDAIEE